MSRKDLLHYLVLFALSYFVFFIKLGDFHLRWWDESMFAVNAYEMMENGKIFSLYFDNAPDLYNTKPPLTVWLQILFIKLLGYNELAIRLPSALASFACVALLFRFLKNHFGVLFAWIGSLVLLTSYGFVHYHTARTGDADALLTLFAFVANLYFLSYYRYGKHRDIFLLFLFLTLGFLTKMYAVLLFVPAYFILFIYKRKLVDFITNRYFVLGVLFFISTVGSVLWLRESETQGYLEQVFYKDAGRLTDVVENHAEPLFFYFDNFLQIRFASWFVLALFGSVMAFLFKKDKNVDILQVFSFYVLSYLLVITLSVTKLEWYDMPLYPYLATLSAYPIFKLLKEVKETKFQYITLIVIFFFPYRAMFYKSQSNDMNAGEMDLEANEYFLHKEIKDKKDLNGIKVLTQKWKGSLLFYQYKLKEIGQNMDVIDDVSAVRVNDKILVSDKTLLAELKSRYNVTLIDTKRNAELFLVEEK